MNDLSSVGQWINSNFAKALSSVHVPVAELRNKPFHFSGIDYGSFQAHIQLSISSIGWLHIHVTFKYWYSDMRHQLGFRFSWWTLRSIFKDTMSATLPLVRSDILGNTIRWSIPLSYQVNMKLKPFDDHLSLAKNWKQGVAASGLSSKGSKNLTTSTSKAHKFECIYLICTENQSLKTS